MAGEESSLAKVVGEYCREASVLVLVFGFLEPIVTLDHRLDAVEQASSAVMTLALSLVAFAVGWHIENRRKR